MFKRLVSFGALALLCSPFVNPASVSAQTSAPTMPACAAGDPIVWLTPRNLYHVEGDVAYGRSPYGAYACLSDAKAKGAVQGPSTPMGPGGGQGMNGQGMRGAGGGMMRGGMGAQAGATASATMPACKAADPVVWLTPRNLYHVKGDVAYGRSPNGAYACLSDAKAKGAVQGPSTPMGPGGGQGMSGQGMMGGGMMRGGMGAQAGAAASATMPACKAADPVVWLTPRNFYFRKGELQYGRSPYGRYLCLSAAKAKGAVHGPNTPMGPGAGRGMGPGMGMAAGTQTAGTGTNSGAAIYARNCAMCHGASGQGVANAFPPLLKSSYVADQKKAVHAVLYGLQGAIVVAGKPYNGAMPAWKGTLSNAEIAAVLTHVRMSWGNAYAPITAASVASVSK
jgi:mono/diheme cytochrome c family protein